MSEAEMMLIAISIGLIGYLFYARYRLRKLDKMEAELKAKDELEDKIFDIFGVSPMPMIYVLCGIAAVVCLIIIGVATRG